MSSASCAHAILRVATPRRGARAVSRCGQVPAANAVLHPTHRANRKACALSFRTSGFVHGEGAISLRARVSPNRRSASVVQAEATSASPSAVPEPKKGKKAFLWAWWKFLRPHTIRGTILGTTAVVTCALMENPAAINWGLLPRALLGLLALLCGNGYIVGINQIYDEDIDKVNKPYLPVAAGELTKLQGSVLCALMALGGLTIVYYKFVPLILQLYAFGLFLGTIYSVPPLRLKQFAVPAFLIIAIVRGFLLNFGVYHATRAALGLGFQWSPQITFITCFVMMFATAIAITKDLPDIEGDKLYNIETFATKFGPRAISFLGAGLLMVNYIGAITAALVMKGMFNTPLMVGAHAALAAGLVWATARLDRAEYTQGAIQDFYAFIWNLFYSEYFLLPFL